MEVMRRVTSGEGTGTVSNGLNSANDLPSVHRGANRCKIKNINVWWLGCVLALLIPANLFSPLAGLGSREWLWDIGLQAKMRVFGAGVVFSYGKDLRSGNNAFYLTMLK